MAKGVARTPQAARVQRGKVGGEEGGGEGGGKGRGRREGAGWGRRRGRGACQVTGGHDGREGRASPTRLMQRRGRRARNRWILHTRRVGVRDEELWCMETKRLTDFTHCISTVSL